MTRRLTLVFALVVMCTLILAGLGTIAVGNARARHTTEQDLRRQAVSIAKNLGDLLDSDLTNEKPAAQRRRARLVATFRNVFDLQDLAILRLDQEGRLVSGQPPAGIDTNKFRIEKLIAGTAESGNTGNLVYAAAPTQVGNALLVVVIVRQANSGLKAALRTFFFAALATLAIGAMAAFVLGRRLSRPIRRASDAATLIANGELSTRLPEPAPNDRDELAELTRSINAMATELERTQVLEQQFLLSISHDLRTPLTSIRGYSEAIRDGAAEPKAAAAVIHNESRRLERLVADLLDLSKLRARGFSLNIEPVDLAALAEMSVQRFSPEAAEQGLTLAYTPSQLAIVDGDHDRLAQVAANLLENALKYAALNIWVAVTIVVGEAVMTIDDDGPGISQEDLPHVFDRLYSSRAKPMRRENSSGLGLAIVKDLVEAMHGTVAATRSPLGGARFVVKLPVKTPG